MNTAGTDDPRHANLLKPVAIVIDVPAHQSINQAAAAAQHTAAVAAGVTARSRLAPWTVRLSTSV
jgi:hypothetical protein